MCNIVLNFGLNFLECVKKALNCSLTNDSFVFLIILLKCCRWVINCYISSHPQVYEKISQQEHTPHFLISIPFFNKASSYSTNDFMVHHIIYHYDSSSKIKILNLNYPMGDKRERVSQSLISLKFNLQNIKLY